MNTVNYNSFLTVSFVRNCYSTIQYWKRWSKILYLFPSKHSSWWRCLEEVLTKTNIFLLIIRLQKTSSKLLQDVLVRTNIFVLSIRLQDVFKPFSRRLQDVFKTSCNNVFKTYSKCLLDVSQIRLEDILIKLFLLISLWEVFSMFARRTAKTFVYRRIHLGHTSEKFMVSLQNLQVLVFQFTTPFNGCL